MKTTYLLNRLLKSWFDGKKFGKSKFFIFPQCAYPFAMCLVDFTEILQFARLNALFAFSRKISYCLALALLWFVCQYVLSNIDNFALWLLNILPSCTCQKIIVHWKIISLGTLSHDEICKSQIQSICLEILDLDGNSLW